MNKWMILGIAATGDREVIKKAYMTQLPKYNPEDDPDGFSRLRDAYEQILKELDVKDKEDEEGSTPLSRFKKRLETVYNDFALRCDAAAWKELLADEACMRLDMADAAEEEILAFLMDNYSLPKEIWMLLDGHFDWQSKEQALKQVFPPGFIDFVIARLAQESLKYELFTTAREYTEAVETHQYDRFIWLYHEIEAMISAGDVNSEPFLEAKNEIEALPVRHVYYDLQMARMHMVKEDAPQALLITGPLFEQMPDDVTVGYVHGFSLLADKQATAALAHFEAMLMQNADDVNAKKGVIDAKISLEDYEAARNLIYEILEEYPYDTHALSASWHVTNELIKIYEEKYEKSPEDFDIKLTLAKHYLNGDQHDKGQALLEEMTPPPEDARYYEYLAACYDRTENYEKAIASYQALIAMERLQRYYAGFVAMLIAAGKQEEALSYIEEALALEEDDKLSKSRLYGSKGLALFQTEKFEDALTALDEGIAANSQAANLYVNKAWTYQAMERFSEAIECCEKAIYIFPYSSDPYTIQMEIFNNAGMYEQMLDVAGIAEQVGYESPRVQYHKAGALRMMGEYEQASEIITALLEAEFDEGYRDFFHVEKAFLAEVESDFDTALVHIKKAIELNPEFTYRYVVLGNMHRLRRDYKEALAIFDKLISEYPDYILALIGRGDVYADQRKYARARTEYEVALAVSEENEQVFGCIISTYVEEKNYEKAVSFAERRLELFETVGNYLDLAFLCEYKNQPDKAESVYQTVIERFPDIGVGHRYYGMYLRNAARHEEAASQFSASIEKEPEQADVYEECAYCLGELSRYEEALAMLDKGEALNAGNRGVILMRKGLIFEDMRRFPESLENMLKASELEDELDGQWEMAEILSRIGLTYRADFNDAENALKYFRAALERDDNSADAHENMGYMYLYFFKDYKEAIKYYDRAIKLRPDEPRTYIERARTYDLLKNSFSARRDYKKALKLYQKKSEEDSSPCYQVYIAACYLGLNRLAQAKEMFQNMIDTSSKPGAWCNRPQCDSCLYGLGLIYEKEKNFSEAWAYYEKAAAISNSVKHNMALESVRVFV